jgi:hypothetical protein
MMGFTVSAGEVDDPAWCRQLTGVAAVVPPATTPMVATAAGAGRFANHGPSMALREARRRVVLEADTARMARIHAYWGGEQGFAAAIASEQSLSDARDEAGAAQARHNVMSEALRAEAGLTAKVEVARLAAVSEALRAEAGTTKVEAARAAAPARHNVMSYLRPGEVLY